MNLPKQFQNKTSIMFSIILFVQQTVSTPTFSFSCISLRFVQDYREECRPEQYIFVDGQDKWTRNLHVHEGRGVRIWCVIEGEGERCRFPDNNDGYVGRVDDQGRVLNV